MLANLRLRLSLARFSAGNSLLCSTCSASHFSPQRGCFWCKHSKRASFSTCENPTPRCGVGIRHVRGKLGIEGRDGSASKDDKRIPYPYTLRSWIRRPSSIDTAQCKLQILWIRGHFCDCGAQHLISTFFIKSLVVRVNAVGDALHDCWIGTVAYGG